MLTSKYVVPLRNEVANWFEKLKTICDVLELWLEVQDLWINIESVFSNPIVIKEMPAEAKRFNRVDKSWLRSQKQSFEMKSVIQCCLGSSVQENTKKILLKDIQKELETCNKSLNSYLDKKRKSFPRYYYLSNSALLTLMSHGSNSQTMSSLKPFLTTLFNSITDFKLEEIRDKEEKDFSKSFISSRSQSKFNESSNSIPQTAQRRESIVSSRINFKEANSLTNDYEITEVYSGDGEMLTLFKKINIEKGCEIWLPRLKGNKNYEFCIIYSF
jgi:dynein heavy chain